MLKDDLLKKFDKLMDNLFRTRREYVSMQSRIKHEIKDIDALIDNIRKAMANIREGIT